MLEESRSLPPKPAPVAAPPQPVTGFGPAVEQAALGSTVTIKGELSGAQALYIDGKIEGGIHFPGQRVTVGRNAVVNANIEAGAVIVMGHLTGNIESSERVDIRSEAVFNGEIVTHRISIDEGAMVKGSVRVTKTGRQEESQPEKSRDDKPKQQQPEAAAASSPAASKPEAPPKPVEPPKPAPAAPFSPQPTSRVAGSKVLFEVQKPGR